MSIKIQINSLEALERLIGDDTELEIEVRRNVVENFAKGFFKNVANVEDLKESVQKEISSFKQEIVNAELEKFAEIVNAELEKFVEERRTWRGTEVTLSESVKREIEETVSNEVYTTINKKITDMDIEEIFKKSFESKIEYEIRKRVKELYSKNITDKINSILNEE